MRTRQHGFTLIELMIVVAIIGILAAIAIPTYTDYTARSQMSEAMNLLDGSKTPVAEFYADRGQYPSVASLGDLVGTLNGKYVADVAITAGANASTGTFEVTATMRANAPVATDIRSDTMTMVTSSGGRRWSCTGGTAEAKFRPAACRP